MTCKELIGVLGDYLEGTVDDKAAAALEAHLADCPPCLAYLNTYRKTRTLAQRAGQAEMPAEMKRRLREFLVKQLGSDG